MLGGDEAVFFHALNDVELANAGTLGVADRVIGRRGLGETRQHGGFSNGDVFQGVAEIRFAGRSKTIGAVAQKDLVHVDLKNLLLGEQVL